MENEITESVIPSEVKKDKLSENMESPTDTANVDGENAPILQDEANTTVSHRPSTAEEAVENSNEETNNEKVEEEDKEETNNEEVEEENKEETNNEEIVKENKEETNNEEIVEENKEEINNEEIVEENKEETNNEVVEENNNNEKEEVTVENKEETNNENVVEEDNNNEETNDEKMEEEINDNNNNNNEEAAGENIVETNNVETNHEEINNDTVENTNNEEINNDTVENINNEEINNDTVENINNEEINKDTVENTNNEETNKNEEINNNEEMNNNEVMNNDTVENTNKEEALAEENTKVPEANENLEEPSIPNHENENDIDNDNDKTEARVPDQKIESQPSSPSSNPLPTITIENAEVTSKDLQSHESEEKRDSPHASSEPTPLQPPTPVSPAPLEPTVTTTSTATQTLDEDPASTTSPLTPLDISATKDTPVAEEGLNSASSAGEVLANAWTSVSNYLWSWFEAPAQETPPGETKAPSQAPAPHETNPEEAAPAQSGAGYYASLIGSFFSRPAAADTTPTPTTPTTLTLEKKTSTSSLSASRLNLLSQQARMPSIQFVGREENEEIRPIVDRELTDYIRPHLPLYQRESVKWVLRYSTEQHGISLNTLYQQVQGAGPLLLAIRDTENNVFGAYVSESFHVTKGFYGTRECFLWKYIKGGLKMYPTSGYNEYFILSESNYIAIGGGNGSYGLYIDEDIQNGQSAECSAFFNEPLSSSVHFQILSLEVWSFEM